jgi:SMI1 / KNR4 family (SUKH-1)
MSQNQYDALLERIRRHCQKVAQVVVGKKKPQPSTSEDNFDSYYSFDHRSFLALKADTTSEPEFAFPPATEEQLHETEEALGFPLPPLLRLLYTRIANGGFGPGYGIIGAIDGFPLEDGMGDNIAYGYLSAINSCTLIRLDESEMISRARWYRELKTLASSDYKPECEHEYFYEFPVGVWPDRLLPLCYWGCGICSCIDARTEHIFQVAASRMEQYIVEYSSASLAEWLERWLAGESLQML